MKAGSEAEHELSHAVGAIKDFLSITANTNEDALIACYLKVHQTYEVMIKNSS